MKANNDAVNDMKIKIFQAPPTSAISLLKLEATCESGFFEVSSGISVNSSPLCLAPASSVVLKVAGKGRHLCAAGLKVTMSYCESYN